MMRRTKLNWERLLVCDKDIRKQTHRPLLGTRIKPNCSQNFMNDEIELIHRIEGFMNALFIEDIREEKIIAKLMYFKLTVPVTRMQQIKHSFERRYLKNRLRERFNELMFMVSE
jgi:hypothetical protein